MINSSGNTPRGTGNLSLNGSKIANIRENEAELNIKQQELMQKWISVVKEVRTAYIKLKAQLSIREKLIKAMNLAEQRRNLLAMQYNNGTIDTATLNQAQNTLVTARRRLINTEKNVSNARVKLCAACGIEIDNSKRPSIAVLNQAQKMYVEASSNYARTAVGSSNVGARLKAATASQSY